MKFKYIVVLAAFVLPHSLEANWFDGSRNIFGKYKTKVEADSACRRWVEKGPKYEYQWETFDLSPKGEVIVVRRWSGLRYSRKCIHEPETSTYIGWEDKGRTKERYYLEDVKEYSRDNKIIKRFHY